MKRLIFIILCTISVLIASAQDLHVNDCFSDNILDNKCVTAVKVKGERLDAYKLSTFRSITITDNQHLATWVRKCVAHDASLANDREEGVKNGVLQYGFYVFRKSGKKYSYIFYRNNNPGKSSITDVTLVYMEGKATLSELKQMFK